MATNLVLDDRLLEEALRIGGRATKRETVTEALQEYINRRKQATVVELFAAASTTTPSTTDKKQRRRR